MREAGWDVAGHGYRWVIHGNLAPDDERKQIQLATRASPAPSHPPLGWYSRYAPSLHYPRLLLEAATNTTANLQRRTALLVKVGRAPARGAYSITHNVRRFARQGMSSGDEYLAYIKNAVQCVLEEDPPAC